MTASPTYVEGLRLVRPEEGDSFHPTYRTCPTSLDDRMDKRVKRTGFPKGEPDSLYHRDSYWINSYHIQNSFQLHIIAVFFDNFITRVYLLHNPEGLGYELTI